MSNWKPGDWRCPGCSGHNFASRNKCRDCGTKKPKSKGKAKGKFNDWDCPNCGNLVFGSKTVCGKCKIGTRDGKAALQKKGDWICGECNTLCFAFRDVCNSCHIGTRPENEIKKKKGDWECSKCDELNFASRVICRKCCEPKPTASEKLTNNSNIGEDILKEDQEKEKKKLEDQIEGSYPKYWKLDSPTDMKFHLCGDKKVKKIQKLCDKTTISDFIGKGRDNYGLSHKRYQIVKVYRVENPKLYQKYSQYQEFIRSEMFGADVYNENESRIKHFNKHLDESINEMYLWHGTKPSIKEIIPVSGFDERVASSGLFGHGIYFAENFSKSDEYATPSYEGDSKGSCFMFLSRVCMGNICHITTGQSGRKRPPCVREFVGKCNGVCTHPRHHSLLAEKGPNCYLKKYREFIVYDRNQCYPEYLIEYKRI